MNLPVDFQGLKKNILKNNFGNSPATICLFIQLAIIATEFKFAH
jgi:hypothetical protein